MKHIPMKTHANHWNGHLLCSIDIETTGLDTEKNDLLEIAIVPMAPDFKVSDRLRPFEAIILPQDPDRYKKDEKILGDETLADVILKGHAWHVVADMIELWVQKLHLPERKKIIPLGHNYKGFDEKFIRYVMGDAFYESIFDYHVRDTMQLALYLNDMADFLKEPIPFPKVDLTYVSKCLRIDNTRRHRALGDAVATAEVYRKLVTEVGPSLLTVSRLIQCPPCDLKSEKEARMSSDDSLPHERNPNSSSSPNQTPTSVEKLPPPSPLT